MWHESSERLSAEILWRGLRDAPIAVEQSKCDGREFGGWKADVSVSFQASAAN